MSTQKILQINPELFKFNQGKKTLKNKQKRERIKTLDDKTYSMKTNKLKKELLKKVKDHQKNKAQEAQKGGIKQETNILASDNNLFTNDELGSGDFEREFNKSLTFLHDLAKKKKDKRQKSVKAPVSHVGVNIEIPKDSIIYNTNTRDQPPYGCLKNGSKPTFKDLNKTKKNNLDNSGKRLMIDLNSNISYDHSESKVMNFEEKQDKQEIELKQDKQEIELKQDKQDKQDKQEIQLKQDKQEIKFQKQPNMAKAINFSYTNDIIPEDKLSIGTVSGANNDIVSDLNGRANGGAIGDANGDAKIDINIPKINRITRTYKYTLGKKKNAKYIGLLIKNRETQKKIRQEVSELKQQPIQEVKNYLREKNLIKLGSQAPNDVLRKLYEDSILAGEITNNNASNLVYNFLN